MRVRVSLFGDVNRHLHGRDKNLEQELPEGATVAELLRALGVGEEGELTIGVNGALGRPDMPLKDGDRVMLVTPMEGGVADACDRRDESWSGGRVDRRGQTGG